MLRTLVRMGVLLTAHAAVVHPAHAQQPEKKITFLTNCTFHGRHTPFFVGVDKGFFREAGFDVTTKPACRQRLCGYRRG
jgi:ABC-type nitrate/sulfonate/bicarbonate transport system substrate-binding protein